MNICRVIVEDEPHTGEVNMSRDEELLERAIQMDELCLRFYRWSEPTISLGHFQKQLLKDIPHELGKLPCVKRLSGGGAILHDREFTYSIVIPAGHPVAFQPLKLYDLIHDRFLEIFETLGLPVYKRGIKEELRESEFLCFLRGDSRDLLCGGHKILGSAQRRRKGAILQHGSLLWQASEHLPEIPGLLDLQPQACSGLDFHSVAKLFYQRDIPEIGCFTT